MVEPVPAGPNGHRPRSTAGGAPGRLPAPTIICLQASNLSTGACDRLRQACELVHRHGGWAHVDGAFGLWAVANPATWHLVDGLELADSWACDSHKWLNLPYDSGFAFCARPDVHAAVMSYTAAYLVGSGRRGPHRRVLAPGPRVRRVGRAAGAGARRGSRPWSIVVAHWPAGSPMV
ncbi:pyridoxal-dependent decarboxylase [Nonomuraea sp. NPDC049269]|uniref:pyridoxal-dependent decarboxylase n=1 Tax=Nonomuraea sp. NPDC049269 TaxID=3364349 RepID=UPI0037152B22